MITVTLKTWLENARGVLRNARALAIFAGLYALLLVTFYMFIATREATVCQVLITYAFLVLMPAEFFVLQSAIVDHSREGKFLWRRIARGAIKLFIATIPILVIALIFWALLDKFQLRYPAPKAALAESLRGTPKPQPLHWPTVIFATIRFLIFAIALPLATIHLWARVSAGNLRTLFSGGVRTRRDSVCFYTLRGHLRSDFAERNKDGLRGLHRPVLGCFLFLAGR